MFTVIVSARRLGGRISVRDDRGGWKWRYYTKVFFQLVFQKEINRMVRESSLEHYLRLDFTEN